MGIISRLLYLKSFCQLMATVDKDTPLVDNKSMNLIDRQLWRQKTEAADKDARAIIARDFSASRMNATKWRETVEALADLHPKCRVRWVDVPAVSDWMSLWIPYPGSTYFDTSPVGPFRTFTIEWLKIDVSEQTGADVVEQRLQGIGVPFTREGCHVRLTGYVRNV